MQSAVETLPHQERGSGRPKRRSWRRTLLLGLLAVAIIATSIAVAFERGAIPYLQDDAAAGTILPDAFVYQQRRSLSCEYASTTIAARMVGHDISEYDFDALVPLHENPHWGYRGNIHGEWGNTTDYGVYNEPLSDALSAMGISSTTFYAHGEASVLRSEIDVGRPVVVWLAMRGDVNSFDEYTADGTRYQLTQWMHVMTAYGYDESGVYLTDPGTAVWRFYPWDTFMAMWNVMDGMGLSVHPTT